MGRSKKTVVKTEEKKGGGSSHAGKKIGQFMADQMARSLTEIDNYRRRQKELGLVKMEVSMNQIARNHRTEPCHREQVGHRKGYWSWQPAWWCQTRQSFSSR